MKSSDPYIGRVFGSYRINSLIACGSFGCVYLAQHVVLPRLAAIKVLHSSYLHSLQEKQRFSQEALILEKLKFRHILEIYDFGISKGIPFLITEYAPNGSLSDLLKRWHPHLLPIHRAIAILTEIGKALAYANLHNIVHHDLKPANILFNGRNEVLLADFGIAIVQSKTTLKRPSASLGTPAYMAPEQFKGKVGQRSDQYSLACIAYELVTGRLPFIASNGSVLGIMHLQDIPISPTQFNPLIPLHVEQAVLKALEKSSSNRYTDISAFITALNRPNLQGRTRRISHNTEEQLLSKAFIFRRLKRFEEALAIYHQVIQINPYCIEAYKDTGLILYELKRFEEALAAFERITYLIPKDADALNSRANVLYKLNRYYEAIEAYTQAIHLDARNPSYHCNMGKALKQLGRFKEAQQAIDKALRLGYGM